MTEEAEASEVAPFGAGDAVVAIGVDRESAAGEEFAPHFDVPGMQQFDEVCHDHIDAVFMEITMISIAKKVQFQRFAFYHVFVGNIGNINGSKVRLTRLWTKAGEFRTIEFDKEIPVRMLIGDAFQ